MIKMEIKYINRYLCYIYVYVLYDVYNDFDCR